MKFQGTLRHYQEIALEAFARDLKKGNKHTNIVAPPGSGKTILGLEVISHYGKNALVLCPNTAIQSQWMESAKLFGAQDMVGCTMESSIAVLTYQAICQFDDPDSALRIAAKHTWARQRAQKTGELAQDIQKQAEMWTGQAAERREKELSRLVASSRKAIAKGTVSDISLEDLLSNTARLRLDELRAHKPSVIVLDESHHLVSLWGYVVKLLIDTFPETHILGLTATPPDSLTRDQANLYHALVGDIDFMVPTPAIVKDGYLAPYQELAYFTQPLAIETAYLSGHEKRFGSLIDTLCQDDFSTTLSFPAWVKTRMSFRNYRERGTISWRQFQKFNPEMARAGARFFNYLDLALPKEAQRSEEYLEKPQVEDWILLLDDYTVGCLAPSSDPVAQHRYMEIATALRDLGYLLTRRGIKRSQSETDRMLAYSRAKHSALFEILNFEYEARKDATRAVILCDTERPRKVSEALINVLDNTGCTAQGVTVDLAAFGNNVRPMLVSGRGIRCNNEDAAYLAMMLKKVSGFEIEWEACDQSTLSVLKSKDPLWQPRTWVKAATKTFSMGYCKILIGTRAMLAEGWDCPAANVLIDLTMATTPTSVRQMRGRSLRLDPANPKKLASNWDIVCLDPDLAAGKSDYKRFVKKHSHLYAPSEDGSIEAGVGHVHPSLSAFAPPAFDQFAKINKSMFSRAKKADEARTRWAIGTPYKAESLRTLVIRDRKTNTPKLIRRYSRVRVSPPDYDLGKNLWPHAGSVGALASIPVAIALSPFVLAVGAAAGAGAVIMGAKRNNKIETLYSEALPLDLAARAVLSSFVRLGEISQTASDSLAIAPRADGYLRCYLVEGSVKENQLFTSALENLLQNPISPRYIVYRSVIASADTFGEKLESNVMGNYEFKRAWYQVPDTFARNKSRAQVFYECWQEWMGMSEMHYCQDQAASEYLAEALAQGSYWESRARSVWR